MRVLSLAAWRRCLGRWAQNTKNAPRGRVFHVQMVVEGALVSLAAWRRGVLIGGRRKRKRAHVARFSCSNGGRRVCW